MYIPSLISATFSQEETLVQCFAKQTVQGPCYEVNLRVFAIAYHSLKMQLRSWSLLSKKIKTGGFQKCKVHCCNFKDFKVTSLQSSAWPGFELGRGRSGPGRNLKICNFEALKVTAMYFTFSETSNLFLFGPERSRA